MAKEKKKEVVEINETPTDVVKYNPMNALMEGLAEEATGFNPTPVEIKITHATQKFEIPSIGTLARLNCVFLASTRFRIMFANHNDGAVEKELNEFTGGRPICVSRDYRRGEIFEATKEQWAGTNDIARMLRDKIAESSGVCASCPLGGNDAWGSVQFVGKTGNGKCCTEKRRLLYWTTGVKVPIILTVPSSSVRNLDGYFSSLQAGGLQHFQVVTEVALEAVTGGSNVYSVAKFSMAAEGDKGLITEEMAEELTEEVNIQGVKRPLFKALVDLFNAREVDEGEEVATESSDDF